MGEKADKTALYIWSHILVAIGVVMLLGWLWSSKSEDEIRGLRREIEALQQEAQRPEYVKLNNLQEDAESIALWLNWNLTLAEESRREIDSLIRAGERVKRELLLLNESKE